MADAVVGYYLCVKDLEMLGSKNIAAIMGKEYEFTLRPTGILVFTDELGCPDHVMPPESMVEYFKKVGLEYRISSPFPPLHYEVGGIKLTTFRDASCQIAVNCTGLAKTIAENWWRIHMAKVPMEGPAYDHLVRSINSAMVLKKILNLEKGEEA